MKMGVAVKTKASINLVNSKWKTNRWQSVNHFFCKGQKPDQPMN